ncbi:MAG: hypothetical protein J6A89_06165 [Clostridia bacterium]|nr:hypothetical protein [Clostridia bacterium]
MSKKNIIITCLVITVAILLIFIYYLIKSYNRNDIDSNISEEIIEQDDEKVENKDENTISASNKENEIISPTAKLEMEQYYKQCGHTIQEEYDVPEEIVNMTEDDIKKYYYGWEIGEFSKDRVKIYKENEGICNEHYIIKDDDEYITIYNKNIDGEEQFVRKTDILTKYLPEEDLISLKQGVEIVGKQDLGSFLEDFE